MKRILKSFALLVILLLSLTSCNKTLNKKDEAKLKELINNTNKINYSCNYLIKESNESDIVRYKAYKTDSNYELTIIIDNNNINYSYDINEKNLYKDNQLIIKKDFNTIDDFSLYVFNNNYNNSIIASYTDFLPFIKEAFDSSTEIKKGRSLNNASMKDSYYYSIDFSFELLMNSLCYEKFKAFTDNSTFSNEDTYKMSIVASLKNNILYPIIEISKNQEILFYL